MVTTNVSMSSGARDEFQLEINKVYVEMGPAVVADSDRDGIADINDPLKGINNHIVLLILVLAGLVPAAIIVRLNPKEISSKA